MKATESYTVEDFKRGKRIIGVFVSFESGQKLYLAYKTHKQIFRASRKTISDAKDEGVACWAFEVDTLMEVRARGVKYVGVIVRNTREIYLTDYENLYNPHKVKIFNNTGMPRRYLPLQYFRRRSADALR